MSLTDMVSVDSYLSVVFTDFNFSGVYLHEEVGTKAYKFNDQGDSIQRFCRWRFSIQNSQRRRRRQIDFWNYLLIKEYGKETGGPRG